MKKNKTIIMLGTRLDTMGGIASVVNVYIASGLFERISILYIASHCDGNRLAKLMIFFYAFIRIIFLLITGQLGGVHAHVASRVSFWRKSLLLMPCFIFRIPVIFHLHGGEFAIFYEKECGSLRKSYVRYVFKRARCIIVLSPFWKKWLQSISSNQNILVIYNPVLAPEFSDILPYRDSDNILFLGRLGHGKGSYDLLSAIALLATKHLHLKLFMAGDGEIENIRSRSFGLGISEHVELLGWIGSTDKESYFASAKLFILPSYNEGLPMSILEAMAHGLPIISTPVGGIPEAVTDGVEGFLVKPGDVGAIADRIDRLLSEPGLAERMGAAARRKIETTFSAEVILPQIEKLYTDMRIS